MNTRTLHPDLAEFVSILEELETLLVKHKEAFWAGKLSRVRKVAEKSDGYCIQLFEKLFGGMGSFNDLILQASASVNSDFASARTRAYQLAQSLK